MFSGYIYLYKSSTFRATSCAHLETYPTCGHVTWTSCDVEAVGSLVGVYFIYLFIFIFLFVLSYFTIFLVFYFY